MPVKSQAQFRAMQAAKHGNSTIGIPADVGAEFVGATSKKRLRKLPQRVRKDAGFNQQAADAVYKAMTAMDPDTALVYGRFLVAEAVHYDLNAHRVGLAKMAGDLVADRAVRLRRHYVREAVAKERSGQDPSQEIKVLVELGKAFNLSPEQRRANAARQPRSHGRFAPEHRKVETDEHRAPIHQAALGIPKAEHLNGEDLSHYQQAYEQISDMLAPFHSEALNARLHLQVSDANGQPREEVVPVDRKAAQPGIQAKLKPGDRIQSATVSVNPQNAPGAMFDALAIAGAPRAGGYAASAFDNGVLNANRLSEYTQQAQQSRIKNPNEDFSATARAFGRLERGSKILQDSLGPVAPQHLQYALASANFVGQYGPEAQKVFGPTADRLAYRYRGTERAPDPLLRRAFDQLRGSGLRGENARQAAIGGIASKDGWAPGPVLQYFHRQLPNPDLNELQRRSGVIPPSEGIVIDRNGAISHQSLGYADDWYLPFNLKHLSALKGGEYIRTRTFGGPTTEDIYTGLVSGARSLTVVSHSGVFTIDFDRNFRGGRRFNDKAGRMVARYGQLLDAVRSEQVSRGGISPSRMSELHAKALEHDPDENSSAFKNKFKELQAAERRNPKLSAEESDAAALEWLASERTSQMATRDGRTLSPDEMVTELVNAQAKQQYTEDAQRAAASGMAPQISEEEYRTAVRRQIGSRSATETVAAIAEMMGQTPKFERAMEKANDTAAQRARALKLDGAGYEAALQALQEQFPYYLKTTYTPWRGAMGIGAMTDRARGGTRDTGYVAPRFNRPQAAEAGYFNPRVGTPKVEASSIRNQNYRVTGGKLVPVERAEKAGEETSVNGSAGTKSKVSDTERQRAANLDLLDEILSQKTFGPNAKLKGEDIGSEDIGTLVQDKTFPDKDIKRLFTASRYELEGLPDDELTDLLDRVSRKAEGPDKLFVLNDRKVSAVRGKGKVEVQPFTASDNPRDLLRGYGKDHAFEGIAYSAARNPSTQDVLVAYRNESTIQTLVDQKLLPELPDESFKTKADALKSKLEQSVSARFRAEAHGGRVDRDEARRDAKAAEGLLRATQLRRNWEAANERVEKPREPDVVNTSTNVIVTSRDELDNYLRGIGS